METIDKFTGNAAASESYPVKKDLEIIYEDDNILLINKPAGMLSQKAKKEDVSLVEYVIGYLLSNGSVTKEELLTFHPGIATGWTETQAVWSWQGKAWPGFRLWGKLLKKEPLQNITSVWSKAVLKKLHIFVDI